MQTGLAPLLLADPSDGQGALKFRDLVPELTTLSLLRGNKNILIKARTALGTQKLTNVNRSAV